MLTKIEIETHFASISVLEIPDEYWDGDKLTEVGTDKLRTLINAQIGVILTKIEPPTLDDLKPSGHTRTRYIQELK